MERIPGSSFGSPPSSLTHKVDDIREPARYKSKIVHFMHYIVTGYNELRASAEIETVPSMFHLKCYDICVSRTEQILKFLRVTLM